MLGIEADAMSASYAEGRRDERRRAAMKIEEWHGKVEALEDEVVAARKVLLLFAKGEPDALDAYDDFLSDYGMWHGVDGPCDDEGETNG